MINVEGKLAQVIEAMRQPLADYVTLLTGLTGPSAQSLTIYGAIAAGSFDTSRHAARNVLVVESVDLEMLRRLSEEGTRLGRAGIAAPLIMTPSYITESLDTFPLELLDIQQCHITFFGDDPFESLAFEDAHLRLQCERELKAVLIGLRQGLLASVGKEKILGALEVDVAESLLRTLRGMLWLEGQKEALPSAQVLDAMETVANRKLIGIRTALDADAHHGWDQFKSLYADVEALGQITNGW